MDTKPKNHLLSNIAPDDWSAIRAHFEPIELTQGAILVDAGELFSHVYFPEDGIVSIVATLEEGSVAEAATTGSEGMISVGAVLGGARALNRKIVQVPGSGYRIELGMFRKLQGELPKFREQLLAYIQVFLGQAMQSVACNGVHSIEERCARWLLMCHDRSEHDRFRLTQEFLADMLGVSRPAVNRVCRTLTNAGIISCTRGVISILDRPRLEDVACECYAVIRQHFDQVLPGSFKR